MKAAGMLLSVQGPQSETEPTRSQGSGVNVSALWGGELPQLIWAGAKCAEVPEVHEGGLPAFHVLC